MKNVREEIEKATTRNTSFEEFNPVFKDLYFSLAFLDESSGSKIEEFDVYFALMSAYNVGFYRGKKAHRPPKWIDEEFKESDTFWELYSKVKTETAKNLYGGSKYRDSRDFGALVARKMYEAGIAEEKSNWTA